MSAHHEVNSLLAQWLQLTQSEADAIQSAAWNRVSDLQTAKASLQSSLTAALQHWTFENGRAELSGDHPFRAQVSRLLSLESRNAQLVATQVRRAHLEMEQRADGLRNLRRLRQSYVHKSDGGLEWYS